MEGCHQFLDLIPKEKGFVAKSEEKTRNEEKKLELRLGPPGGEWTNLKDSNNNNNNSNSKYSQIERKKHEKSLTSFGGYFSSSSSSNNQLSPWLHLQSSQPCSNRVALDSEKKAFSPPPANTAVLNNTSTTAQKRTAPAPVVGWPPIRSFRKNLASGSSSKSASESTDVVPEKVSREKTIENCPKSLFVKINMDGIPIGRKVDLKAYDSYEKLSYAVDELFRGLLAAQNDDGGIKDNEDGSKVVKDILDGNGEYTLVYEDNEGDRMLVGDVPWHMFVSTVKRLRVLKSSELPTLSRGSKPGKALT